MNKKKIGKNNINSKKSIKKEDELINSKKILKEKPIPNTTLKRNIKKVIKIEAYNHDNITLRIKTIKDILTKLMLDNLTTHNIFLN